MLAMGLGGGGVLVAHVDLNVANFLLSLDTTSAVVWWKNLVSGVMSVLLGSTWMGPLLCSMVWW